MILNLNDWKLYSTAFEMNVAVSILRLQEGLDCSKILADIDDLILNKRLKDKVPSFQAKEWVSISSNPSISPNPDTSSISGLPTIYHSK